MKHKISSLWKENMSHHTDGEKKRNNAALDTIIFDGPAKLPVKLPAKRARGISGSVHNLAPSPALYFTARSAAIFPESIASGIPPPGWALPPQKNNPL